ncbi:MAG: flavodoxin [Methanobrevibacter boviskoreani]|jgi:flavodoxin|uniref:flavodoxin n=1 Tax=Methanobrevibacter boviskoreani TaxID=1348249 RepID=UPI00059368E2|nr:flavodoxin [Methanobrevibacter boviskoreani]MCI6775024.1 flavodoxin [Methanobrevibacter boviskoreani]MCI6930085.1 flavodoxin [Methanobrevibacter boviskoreani]MDD6257395.1 flavodoxin [Methanobrevibacter boviskoreani]MDY5614831.1 flavodoxin [Methanobrevibacter boviskoreani]
MVNNLVAYFSCTGTSKNAAIKLANVVDGDLFEILPETPYSSDDLDYRNPESRNVKERDGKEIPKVSTKVNDMDQYDTVYLVFPIWWYVAPKIINSFLEEYDLSGKRIVVSYTSGGSSLGNTIPELEPSAPGAEFIPGVRFSSSDSEEDIKSKLNL